MGSRTSLLFLVMRLVLEVEAYFNATDQTLGDRLRSECTMQAEAIDPLKRFSKRKISVPQSGTLDYS